MMTQEEFMDAMAMKRQGLTIKEIADELGYHPSTISSWLKNGGPPPKRESVVSPAIDGRWAARIAELLRAAPRLLATSVFELIRAEGYERSYPSVSRHVHAIGGPRFHAAEAASTRIVCAWPVFSPSFWPPEVRTPRCDFQPYVSFGAPPLWRASFSRKDSPEVATRRLWCSSRSSRLTAVVCSGRNRPQSSNGQCEPMPSDRRS